MDLMRRSSVAAVVLAATSFICAEVQSRPAVQVFSTAITEAEVSEIQRGWCDGLLAISAAYQSGGYDAARAKAAAVIDAAYAFNYGPVAFKPTEMDGARPINEAIARLKETGDVSSGDRVLVTKGDFNGAGGTNAMKIVTVE